MGRALGSLFAVLLVGVGSELIAGPVIGWIEGTDDPMRWTTLAWGVGLALGGFGVAAGVVRSIQRSPYDFSREATTNPKMCQVLVLPLSYLPRDVPSAGPSAASGSVAGSPPLRRFVDAVDAIEPGGTLLGAAAAVQRRGRFPWVLSLVAIQYHYELLGADHRLEGPGPLRRVAILGSRGASSSFEEIPVFVEQLNRLRPEGLPPFRLLAPGEPIPSDDESKDEIIVVDRSRSAASNYDGVDFESIQSVHQTVRRVIGDLTARDRGRFLRWGKRPFRDVSIDFTSGMKQVSVGAALASLESNAFLQYAGAEGEGDATRFVVRAYDYGLSERPSINLG